MTSVLPHRIVALLGLFVLITGSIDAQLQLMRQPPKDPIAGSPLRACSADGRVCATKFDTQLFLSLTEVATGRVLRTIPTLDFAFSLPDLPALQMSASDLKADATGAFTLRTMVLQAITLQAVCDGVPLRVDSAPDDSSVFLVIGRLHPGSNSIVVWAVDSFGRKSAEAAIASKFTATSMAQPKIVLRLAPPEMHKVVFSRDGSKMATASGHNFMIWDMQTRRQLSTTLDHQNPVMFLDFAGRTIGFLCHTGEVLRTRFCSR